MTTQPITGKELDKLLSALTNNTGKKFGAYYLVEYLAKYPYSTTTHVCQNCSVGNISDAVHTRVNPKIIPLGYYVHWVRPPEPIKNQRGEPTSQVLWTLSRLPKAANDPFGSFADDWEKVKSEHPELDMKRTLEYLETENSGGSG